MFTPPFLTFSKKSAFTLVELSIVLVIIGLIVGGVLVGKDLIRAAENRAFVSQLQSYNAAVNAFKLKYNCLPGDCANATDYGFTGNGNGNGMISGVIGTPSWTFYSWDYSVASENDNAVAVHLNCCGGIEAYNSWQHLQSAGLVPTGMMTLGVTDGVGTSYSLPPAKNDDTGIVVTGWVGKHYYRSGAVKTRAGGNVIWSLNFSPVDAAYIFEKMEGTTISITKAHGGGNNTGLYPDNLGAERVLVSGSASSFGAGLDNIFYRWQSQGAGGATASYCIDTSITPAYFNLKNPDKLCALVIQADF